MKKSIAANDTNCANRKTMEKANKRVKKEPRRVGVGLVREVRGHSGVFQHPHTKRFRRFCGVGTPGFGGKKGA